MKPFNKNSLKSLTMKLACLSIFLLGLGAIFMGGELMYFVFFQPKTTIETNVFLFIIALVFMILGGLALVHRKSLI